MHPASLLSLVLSIILTAVPKLFKSSFLDFVLFPYRESSQPDWSELLKQFYCKLKKNLTKMQKWRIDDLKEHKHNWFSYPIR